MQVHEKKKKIKIEEDERFGRDITEIIIVIIL